MTVEDDEGLSLGLLPDESLCCDVFTNFGRFVDPLFLGDSSSAVCGGGCFVAADCCCLHFARLFLNHTCKKDRYLSSIQAWKVQ